MFMKELFSGLDLKTLFKETKMKKIITTSFLGIVLLLSSLGFAYDNYIGMTEHVDYGTYLTDLEGKTLYTFSNDKPGEGTSACYGGCAGAWPPFLVELGEITYDEDFLGELSFITRTDGSTQLAYNGWPLYYYVGDATAGDANGHGIGNVWFVATYGAEESVLEQP